MVMKSHLSFIVQDMHDLVWILEALMLICPSYHVLSFDFSQDLFTAYLELMQDGDPT